MCDRIGISGIYDFICPYNITYVYDASAAAEKEKVVLSRRQWKDVSEVRLYFAPLNKG